MKFRDHKETSAFEDLLSKAGILLSPPYINLNIYDEKNNKWIEKVREEGVFFHTAFYENLKFFEKENIWCVQLSPNPLSEHYLKSSIPAFKCDATYKPTDYTNSMAGVSVKNQHQDIAVNMRDFANIIALFPENFNWVLIWERDGGDDEFDDGFRFYKKSNST